MQLLKQRNTHWQRTPLDRFLSIAILEIGKYFSRASKQTGWKFRPEPEDEVREVHTTGGQKKVTGTVTGVARVIDVFTQPGTSALEVTFATGKFAALCADGMIGFEWLPVDRNIYAPLCHAPSEKVADEFSRSSFTIALLPQFAAGRWITPGVRKGKLLRFEFLTTDLEGREGVAVRIESAKLK